ncbi:MAG: AMP-binding protein [Methylocystis sp.]|uniref:AMP-binding protein n=1 Tax=Methylocystis sp. TaxID=1911079 RepID=UPI003DA4CCB5
MTARAALIGQEAPADFHPLTLFGFDALVAGAARHRPGALIFRDAQAEAVDELTYADLYSRVGACVAQLRELGLSRGETILVCAPPGAQGFALLTAALAEGLEPVLAPMPLPLARGAIARAAKDLSVSAVFAPARFCGLDFEAALLDLAAQAPSIRLMGTLGGQLDGAVDFSGAALSSRRDARLRLTDEWSVDDFPRIGALGPSGEVRPARQGELIGAALDLVRRMRLTRDTPILSLCAPSGPAALVGGPLAALLGGAPLHSLAPFSSARFLATLDALGAARLVAPAAVLSDLAHAGLLTNGALVGVVAIGDVVAAIPEAACPVLSLRDDGGSVIVEAASHAAAHIGARVAAE